jgi:hypothetical protein
MPRALYSIRGVCPPSSVRARWATRLALIGYLLVTSVLAPGGRAGVAGAGFFVLTA